MCPLLWLLATSRLHCFLIIRRASSECTRPRIKDVYGPDTVSTGDGGGDEGGDGGGDPDFSPTSSCMWHTHTHTSAALQS